MGMKTALQIGDISATGGRIWITGLVLSGSIGAGDTLEAVGLAATLCVVDEVRVKEASRRAVEGEECSIFLRNPDAPFLHGGTQLYFGLVDPGSAARGTLLRVSLTWAPLFDGPRQSHAPASGPITADTLVELRFADIKVSAMLKRPTVVRPPGGTNEWDLVLHHPLPVIPRCGFSVNINGEYAAMGKIIQGMGRQETD